MAKVIVIAGKSNTGKSTLISTLNAKETFVINCLGKDLPFRGWKTQYSVENKNIVSSTSFSFISNVLQRIDKDLPNIKTIVLDDVGYIMNTELMDRSEEKNFDKYSSLASHMFQVLNVAKNTRDDLTVILMFHQEDLDDINQSADIKIPGKMMKAYYHPAELSTVCVFTHVEYDEEGGDEEYYLVVKKSKKYPLAKTPTGMFKEKLVKANLQNLLNTIEDYNSGKLDPK